jgi:hypothetical protein
LNDHHHNKKVQQQQHNNDLVISATNPSMKQQQQQQQQHDILASRLLALGDFASLNAILSSVQLPINESPVLTETVAGSPLTITLDNITCTRLHFGDVVIDWSNTTTTSSSSTTGSNDSIQLSNNVTLKQVDIVCAMQYTYSYLFFNGAGALKLLTSESTIRTATQIIATTTNETLSNSLDVSVNMTSCSADIVIDELVFDGEGLGLLGTALNSVENLVRDSVAERMEVFFCDFLGDFQQPVENGITEFLSLVNHKNVSTYDPLKDEEALNAPSGVELLDFQNPKGTNPSIVNMLIEQVQGFVGATTDSGDLKMNELIQTLLLADDGSISIDIGKLFDTTGSQNVTGNGGNDGLILFDDSNQLGEWVLRFTSAKIYGLDSFTEIRPLEAIGQYTLESSMSLSEISVQLDAVFEMITADGSLKETFVIDITVNDISLSLALLLAIDLNTMGSLPLGALLDMQNVLPCIMESVYGLGVSGLDMKTMTLQPPVVRGFDSPGLQRIMSGGLDAIFSAYDPVLRKALPRMIETAAVGMLDNVLQGVLTSDGPCTPTEASQAADTFIDFRDLFLSPEEAEDYGATGLSPYGDLAQVIKKFVDKQFLTVNATTGRTGFADMFIVPMTKNQSGEVGSFIMDDVVRFAGNIGVGESTARLELWLSDVRIDNLDSIGDPFVLLEPVRNEEYSLNNTITLGVSPNPIRMQASLFIHLEKGDSFIHNNVDLSLEIDTASFMLMLAVKMSEKSVMSFPLNDIFDWNCWLATIPAPQLNKYGLRISGSEPTLSVSELAMAVATLNLTVDCANCTSTVLTDLDENLGSDEAREGVKKSATNAINYLLGAMSGETSVLQTSLDRILADAARFCPHHSEYDPNATKTVYESFVAQTESSSDTTNIFALLGTLITILLLVVVIRVCLRYIVGRRHRKWLLSISDEQVWAIYQDQEQGKDDERAVNQLSSSLFRSNDIPLLVRALTPVILVGNIALFLSGHFSKGGNVVLSVQVGEQSVVFDDFYSFSIAQSGIDLWNAGAKALAILMLIFAGIWPYTKQLITLLLWFTPPRWVSTSVRGSFLLWMDFLAKWSMIDVFVMIVTVAAFRVQVQSPPLDFLPDDLYQLDIMVVPVWGLYANMLAQLLSQFTSHFIIAYHRLVVYNAQKVVESERKTRAVQRLDQEKGLGYGGSHVNEGAHVQQDVDDLTRKDQQDDDRYSLSKHAFTRPHRGESQKLVVKSGVNMGVVIASLISIGLVAAGCGTPAVSFDYQGLVGLAVESGQNFEPAIEHISVFSLAKMMIDQARFLDTTKDMIGMLSVSTLLIFSTLIVPITLVAILLCEWFTCLNRATRRKLRSTAEIFQAWQYIEVFVLAVLVGAWQIGDLSTLLFDDYCGGSLGGTLSQLVSFGLIKQDDATCFQIRTALEPGAFILVFAGVLLLLLGSFVSKAVSQRDRDENRFDMGMYASRHLQSAQDGEKASIEKITPIPVLFTDQFRWLLTSCSGEVSANPTDSLSDNGGEPE